MDHQPSGELDITDTALGETITSGKEQDHKEEEMLITRLWKVVADCRARITQ